jgi:nitroreductase
MEFKEAVARRASCRQFTDKDVPEADLREMAHLAGLAPSVNNSQPWRFIAVKNRDLLKCMADAVHGKLEETLPLTADESERKAKAQVDWFSTFFADAPVVMAVATRPYEAIVDKALVHSNLTHDDINAMRGCPDIQSVGASIENLILAATDMGYGACWLSGPLVAREAIESCLGIESPWRLAAMVAIGEPAAAINQREKKPVEDIFELRA